MWNNSNKLVVSDDDDSWEVRAFEEDTATGNLLGCTWPPRSYACNFCRREFRSAQALGGHMNVHRRDRARLHRGAVPPPPQQQQPFITPASPEPPPPPPAVVFPTGREFMEANGLCVLYPIPPDNSAAIFVPTRPIDFQSAALFPIAPFSTNNIINPRNTPAANCSSDPPPFNRNNSVFSNYQERDEDPSSAAMEEELDLELRLGRRSPP